MSKISLKVPAYLSNFSSLDNGRTIAKLKMFYVGETADGRIFDKVFAEKLVQSLPYCPVVAYYSDITKDFLGHNTKQYIYGLVQPTAEAKFETDENGVEWFVTEVMLYTDREDNIGAVANKIVGKAQSLEMKPGTAKYETFRDENGKLKVKFTDAELCGLSVLGDNQNPAFTGSEFFTDATDFSDMREKFENFFSCLEEISRGEQMEKEQFSAYANFYRLSYTDKMKMAQQSVLDNLGEKFDCAILDMDDATFTAEIFSFETWTRSFKRFDYTIDDSGLALGEGVEVYRKWLSAEEIQFLEDYTNGKYSTPAQPEAVSSDCAAEDKEEDSKDPETTPEEDKKEKECASLTPTKEDEEEDSKDPEEEDKEEKEEGDGDDSTSKEDDENKNQCSSNTSALSDSERAELEAYREQAKKELISSYDTMLPKEVLDNYTSRVSEYDLAKLQIELALEFSKYSMTHKGETKKNDVPFSFSKVIGNNETNTDSYEELVRKYKN